MTERLPTEIADMLPDGQHLTLDDITHDQARRAINAATVLIRELRATAGEYKDSGKRDLVRARAAEAALARLCEEHEGSDDDRGPCPCEAHAVARRLLACRPEVQR